MSVIQPEIFPNTELNCSLRCHLKIQ